MEEEDFTNDYYNYYEINVTDISKTFEFVISLYKSKIDLTDLPISGHNYIDMTGEILNNKDIFTEVNNPNLQTQFLVVDKHTPDGENLIINDNNINGIQKDSPTIVWVFNQERIDSTYFDDNGIDMSISYNI